MLMFALPAANAQKVNTSTELNKLQKVDLSLENPRRTSRQLHGWLMVRHIPMPTSSQLRRLAVVYLYRFYR